MFAYFDYANIIGILLEILGFIILIPGVFLWFKSSNKIINSIDDVEMANTVDHLILFALEGNKQDFIKLRMILEEFLLSTFLTRTIISKLKKNSNFSATELIIPHHLLNDRNKSILSILGAIFVIAGLFGQLLSIFLEKGLG